MSETPSAMLPLGTKAPDFCLPDFDGREYRLDDFSDARAYLVMFICNHCPYVIHVRSELVNMCKEFQGRGVVVVAINSNDVTSYPEDSPERMGEIARTYGYSFPYLYDESQNVARAYQATCTPDFFLYDAKRTLVYRGQMDDSRPGNLLPSTGEDLRAAVAAVLAGKAPSSEQKPSVGCNIKWSLQSE